MIIMLCISVIRHNAETLKFTLKLQEPQQWCMSVCSIMNLCMTVLINV